MFLSLLNDRQPQGKVLNYITTTEHAMYCHIATYIWHREKHWEINIYEFSTFQKSIQSWGHLIQVLEVTISISILCFAWDRGSRRLYSLLTLLYCQCDKSLLSDLIRSCICVVMILPVRCPVSVWEIYKLYLTVYFSPGTYILSILPYNSNINFRRTGLLLYLTVYIS